MSAVERLTVSGRDAHLPDGRTGRGALHPRPPHHIEALRKAGKERNRIRIPRGLNGKRVKKGVYRLSARTVGGGLPSGPLERRLVRLLEAGEDEAVAVKRRGPKDETIQTGGGPEDLL